METTIAQRLEERITQMEKSIGERLGGIEGRLTDAPDVFRLFREGLDGYHCDEKQARSQRSMYDPTKWLHQALADKDLRYPHHKILRYLVEQVDYAKKLYKEAHYSRIVKAARLCKNNANEYLALLVEKGYLERRTDGYRVHYRVTGKPGEYSTKATQQI